MANQALLSVPIRPWVPRWLGIVTAFVVMLPIILINGAYTGTITEVSGTLGVLSEDISMAYYATSAGMAVAYPLIPKVRPVVTTKTILLIDLLLQVILSFICAQVNQMDIIIVCSFFIGFLKAFAMLEIILMIRPLFSPKNVRSEFYAYFYPIVFSAGQVSMAVTAQLAYYYQWQYMYYFVILLLLVAISFVLMFFRYARRPINFPFREIDWKSILLMASILLFTIYSATYGKTLDWFSSTKITVYAIAIPVLIWLFLFRQKTRSNPYLRLEVLNSSKALIGYFYMMLVMFFSATSYMNSIIRIDSVHANFLNLWMLPGFICGAVICFWWFRWQRWRFRILISGGMLCYVIYLGILYFGIMPNGTYEMLYLPMFLRGMGMMILFIAFGVYAVEDMNPKLMIYNAFFLIACRSVLAPALASSFFNNMLYRVQLQGMAILSENMSMQNPLAAQQYNQSLNSALAQGHNMTDATQLASNSLYTILQSQSLLLALKTIIGYVLIFAIVVMVIARFTPFHKTLKVEIVKTGEDMV
jgi:MFS family permease